jgi:hypothetical protein
VKSERSRQRGKDALELIEEAIYLLRSASLSNLAWYFVGTLPFVLGALYFWGDMSRSPFAGQHLVGGALALACLFVWMKTCQAVFSRKMRCLVSGESEVFTFSHCWRTLLMQSALQPTGLFVLILALVPTLPFPWVFAFYQNVCVLDDGETLDVRGLVRRASSQALLWPRQNHFMLAIMGCFGLFVSLNVMTACFALPSVVKMLLGIETVFTRSGLSLLNTTFFAATFSLAYVCIDPILKTIYALRCFYGESQRSGSDLKAELRRTLTLQPGVMLIPTVILVICVLGADPVAGEQPRSKAIAATVEVPTDPRAVSSSMSASELDRVIQQIIQQPKYSWREQRNKLLDEGKGQKGLFARLFDRLRPFLVNSLKAIGRWLDALMRRLFARQRTAGSNDIASRWVMFLHLVVYGLIVATAAVLIWLCYRVWQSRREKRASVAGEPLQPIPDLLDEHLGAEQMPEDSWMGLAHKLLAEGELRLALRAFYLASLAQLAAKNLIQLARFKSNWDYERELRRRAHALPGLVAVFGENLLVFDRAWYGMYEINGDVVNQFAQNVERIRTAEAIPARAEGAA